MKIMTAGFLLLLTVNTWAQEMSGEGGGEAKALQQAQAATTAAIKNLIAGYGKERRNMLFTLTPRIGFVIGYGQGQEMIMKNNQSVLIPYAPNDSKGGNQNKMPLDKQATLALLTATGSAIQAGQKSLNNAICAPRSTESPGGITVSPSRNEDCGFMDTAETMNNYDIASLVGPLGYPDPRAAQVALNYIKFASNLAQPYPADLPDLISSSNINLNNLLPYLTAIRSYAAIQSVGLSNLYQIYASRVRVPGLGAKAGLPTPDASPLEVDEYNAKRRVVDREWYNQMETASPATIARETLYLAAEKRLEDYKLLRALERLIAINSMMQLQLARSAAISEGDGLPVLKKKLLEK